MTAVDADQLRRDTLAGLKWSFASQGFNQVVGLTLTIILARLLTPREFGLVGMVTVLSGFGYALRDLGLGSAIVQSREASQEALSAAFWMSVLVGAALCGLLAALSGPIAAFYQMPALRPIALWLSIDFLLTSLNVVQEALLQRRLDFRRLLLVDGISNLASGAAAIAAAASGLGAWSLVIRALAASALRSIVFWLTATWRPSLRLRLGAVAGYFRFSLPLLGTMSLNYWTRNIDKLLIGRFLGDAALGIYGRAYAIMLYPVQNISQAISRVMFPTYSRMEGDKAKVKRTYLRVTRSVAVVTFPMMLGLVATAEPFVLTVLGDQWRELAPVLRVLAILGASQSIGTMNGDIFLSQGATRSLLRVGGTARVVLMLFIAAGLPWGVVGVAVSYTGGALLVMFPVLFFVGRLIDLSLREWLANLAGVLACAALMAGGVAALDLVWADAGLSPQLRLLLAVAVGGVAYLGLLTRLQSDALEDAVSSLRAALQR